MKESIHSTQINLKSTEDSFSRHRNIATKSVFVFLLLMQLLFEIDTSKLLSQGITLVPFNFFLDKQSIVYLLTW